MKIAVFYNLPASGAKRVVYEQVKGLTKKGHHIDLYTYSSTDTFFDPSDFAKNTYYYFYNQLTFKIPFLRKITSDMSDFFLLKRLHKEIAKDIDKRKYDFVLIHTDAYTQAPFLLQFLKTKNVYFCLEPLRIAHEYVFRIDKSLPTINKIYDWINLYIRKNIDIKNARAAQNTIAISYFGRELMIQAFDLYPEVSYIGVDTKVFRKKQVKKKNQILFVGQKLSVNGYDIALRALSLLPKKNRPKLEVLSWTKNAKERISDEELVTKYNESLITLSLSTFDTFGLVPLESLACRTPVVAFNVAGYRETIQDKKTGFLVEFSEKYVAEKIQQLLEDKRMSWEIADYGRKWVVGNWTWENHINHLENLFKKWSKKEI